MISAGRARTDSTPVPDASFGKQAEISRFGFTGRIRNVFPVDSLIYIRGEDALTVIDPVSLETRRLEGQSPEKVLSGVNGAVFFCEESKAVNAADTKELKELKETQRGEGDRLQRKDESE